LQDADSDIRYMTLNDLSQMFTNGNATFMAHDYAVCAKVVEGLLHTLNDTNGEVQNMAIQCLGPFVNKAPESVLCPTIEKISTIKTENTIDNSIPAIAVRAIVVALPHPVPGVPHSQKVLESYSAISRALIPRLVGRIVTPVAGAKPVPATSKGMLQHELDTGSDSSSLDLLSEVARCFGPMLQEAEVGALENITMQILESSRCGSVVKKKAVASLSALSLYFSDELLAKHISYTIEQLRQPHLTQQQRKLYLTMYGSLAKSVPQNFGPYLKTLTPFVLAPLSQQELDDQEEAQVEADGERDVEIEEVREAALTATETFLEVCSHDMKGHLDDVLDSTIRFLSYDPNVADDEDEDMDDEEEDLFDGEEDFEEETGFDDEDDVSWKVRRCSAKALHALVGVMSPTDPAMFDRIAPALISRFKEREESVRGEVISALAFLVSRTGSSLALQRSQHASPPQSRKRRRGFSDSLGSDLQAQQTVMNGYASPTTPPPVDSSGQGLARINPDIVKGAAKLLKSSTPATKQVVIALLKDMVSAQQGGLSAHVVLVIDPVIEAMSSSSNASISNVAKNALRVEALSLLRIIAETHSGKVLQPHLEKIVPALVSAAKDRFTRVSVEALTTIEVFVKALTPPRSAASKGQNGVVVKQLFDVIVDRISASDSDADVRQKAIRALGLLIGRTSSAAGSSLLPQEDRFAGQRLLADRLNNELTRLASVRAVDTIAVLATNKDNFPPGWVDTVALILSAQLRKASRSLRGASLTALRMLAVNKVSRTCMSERVVDETTRMLVPLFDARELDLHMAGPALIVLAAFADQYPQLVATPDVINAICMILKSAVSGGTLDALITLVEALGRAGAGKELMATLLQIAPQCDADVTGQVIGTLLVSGGQSLGVSLEAFTQELKTQKEESRRCLALSVLGEAGLRLSTTSPLTPETFTAYFSDPSEKVKLAAAVALGRAGAGNVTAYLPDILEKMSKGKQYLLLHSLKELLQHSNAEDDIRPHTKALWDNIIASGQAEDNKVVGAECIGRLAIIDPAAYLPQLQAYLQNQNATIRGMVIASLRYIYSDTDAAYNPNLKSSIIPMLATMLADGDLNNQRLSLSTFNSALHNKLDLILPQLPELLPYAMQATLIRPELVREVQMGPFKHKIDDGLEIRKSAYETLYVLLDSAATRQRLDMPSFFDRIVAGVADEHEIKILCCLVLTKLLAISPTECARHLDALAQHFRAVLSFKPKDNAVKQELEKLAEQNKAVVKVSVAFNKVFGSEDNRNWKEYFDWVRSVHPMMLRAAEEEMRSDGR
jgi:cullin-associated NEDD8-dissociated protein 1